MRVAGGVRGAALVMSVLASGPTAALGADWADAGFARTAGERWRVSLEGESVGDSVAHAPNAADGGFEPAREKRRYDGASLALDWQPSERWRLRAGVGRRTVTFLRDRYAVDGLHVGVARRLPSPHPAIGLELMLDANVNFAAELYKNSWTEVGGSRLGEARLFDARDDTLMLSVAARSRRVHATNVALVAGVGRTRAAHARLAGIGTDAAGCRYRFETSADAGELELLESCGSLVEFRESYASEAGIERRLGFSPTADLEYTADVVQAGIAFERAGDSVDLTASYVYRRRARGAFDERIREQGGRTVASSHTTSLRAGFALTPSVGLDVGLHYRSTAYLDELPLLYNVFTSERFLKNSLAFSLGASLAF